MKIFRYAALAVGLFLMPAVAKQAHAQVSVGIGVGGPAYYGGYGYAPACEYGYYGYAPYSCAPYGYYGPSYFNGGVFIGAGPWFHGSRGFHGYVNNNFHPEHGYTGPMPNRGERAEPSRQVNRASFKGNEQRDGRGHAIGDKH